MNSVLFLSAGKHGQMLKLIKKSLNEENIKLITASNTKFASGLHSGDDQIILGDIREKDYIETVIKYCEINKVNAIFTLLDEETVLLSKNKDKFEEKKIKLFTSEYETNLACLDKYIFYEKLSLHKIPTIKTYKEIVDNLIYPVIIKPNLGKGSVGVKKIENKQKLKEYYDEKMIIQEFIHGPEYDIDAYVDMFSGEVIDIYIKEKLAMGLGGANITKTVYNTEIKALIEKTVKELELYGPLNFDVIYNGEIYLVMEVNARFGAGYVHTHLADHDFVPLIVNNLKNIENTKKTYIQEQKKTFIKDNSFIMIDE